DHHGSPIQPGLQRLPRAAAEAPQPRRGAGARRARDGRGRPLLHRRAHPDLRDPGRAGQGRPRSARRPRPPLRRRRARRGEGGPHGRAHGRGGPASASRL
ncbi:MAG: Repressor CsoR of the copZA operon, partial [uncultured Solirubrobacteraceae bacterium]